MLTNCWLFPRICIPLSRSDTPDEIISVRRLSKNRANRVDEHKNFGQLGVIHANQPIESFVQQEAMLSQLEVPAPIRGVGDQIVPHSGLIAVKMIEEGLSIARIARKGYPDDGDFDTLQPTLQRRPTNLADWAQPSGK